MLVLLWDFFGTRVIYKVTLSLGLISPPIPYFRSIRKVILNIKATMVVSVCVGSAWKILPITARSLWSFPR